MANTPTLQIDQIAQAVLAVPGVFINVINDIPSGTKTKADATFASIDTTNLKLDKTFPVAGKYIFTLKGQLEAITNYVDCRLRLVIDGGTGNEITTDDLPGNIVAARTGAREEFYLIWLLDITAGLHNVDIQWRRSGGTGTLQTDANSGWHVTAQLISGSGAGGSIVTKNSVSQISVTAVDTSWQDLITLNINAYENEQVLINVSGFGRPDSGTQSMRLRVYDNTTATELILQMATTTDGTQGHEFLGCCFTTGPLDGGAHEIKIQSNRSASYPSTNFVINEMTACITQFRGGLVPIQVDDVDLIDTPRTFNFKNADVTQVNGVVSIPIPKWKYLDSVLPTSFAGTIQALFQFDDTASSLTDRSANSNDLTLITGTEQYTALNGLIGLALDGSTYYKAAIDSSVQLTGDLTLELLCSLYAATQFYYLISAQGVVGTPPDAANNILWGIRGSGNKRKLNFLHETGTGGTYEQPDMLSHPVEGQMTLVTMVRSGLNYKLYLDGKLMDTQAFTTATSGGTSAKLVLGAREDGGNIFNDAVIYGVRLCNDDFTDAQVLESANRVRGLI